MTITQELTNDELNNKMKNIFKNKEEYDAFNKSLVKELFGIEKKVKKDD